MILQDEKDTIIEFSGTTPFYQVLHDTNLINSYFLLLCLKKVRDRLNTLLTLQEILNSGCSASLCE